MKWLPTQSMWVPLMLDQADALRSVQKKTLSVVKGRGFFAEYLVSPTGFEPVLPA
jgi:hypothetical protein